MRCIAVISACFVVAHSRKPLSSSRETSTAAQPSQSLTKLLLASSPSPAFSIGEASAAAARASMVPSNVNTAARASARQMPDVVMQGKSSQTKRSFDWAEIVPEQASAMLSKANTAMTSARQVSDIRMLSKSSQTRAPAMIRSGTRLHKIFDWATIVPEQASATESKANTATASARRMSNILMQSKPSVTQRYWDARMAFQERAPAMMKTGTRLNTIFDWATIVPEQTSALPSKANTRQMPDVRMHILVGDRKEIQGSRLLSNYVTSGANAVYRISVFLVGMTFLPILLNKFRVVGTSTVSTSILSLAMGWWAMSTLTDDEETVMTRKQRLMEALEKEAALQQDALDSGIPLKEIQKSRRQQQRRPLVEDFD